MLYFHFFSHIFQTKLWSIYKSVQIYISFIPGDTSKDISMKSLMIFLVETFYPVLLLLLLLLCEQERSGLRSFLSNNCQVRGIRLVNTRVVQWISHLLQSSSFFMERTSRPEVRTMVARRVGTRSLSEVAGGGRVGVGQEAMVVPEFRGSSETRSCWGFTKAMTFLR